MAANPVIILTIDISMWIYMVRMDLECEAPILAKFLNQGNKIQ